MSIREFVLKSQGEWSSMRTSHSLAFQKFEEIQSELLIQLVPSEDKEVKKQLIQFPKINGDIVQPFSIEWSSESYWDSPKIPEKEKGKSLLIPIEKTKSEGKIIKTQGYLENIKAISEYLFLSDGTLILNTEYGNSIAEERIWFVSDNLRCRSSVIKSKNNLGIFQTSYASELRKIK